MRPNRSASVSTIASFASALSGEYGTPPLTSSSESYFVPSTGSPQLGTSDVEDEDEASTASGPSTPRAKPNLVLDTSVSPPPSYAGKAKAKGSFWIASDDDAEDEEVSTGAVAETWTAGPEDEQFLERLSTSSRGTLHGSPVMGIDDPLLELGISLDDVVSDDGTLPSEDDEDLQNEEWNELEEGEHIPLTNASIRMDEESAPLGGRKRKRRKWREAEQEFARGGHKELWQVGIYTRRSCLDDLTDFLSCLSACATPTLVISSGLPPLDPAAPGFFPARRSCRLHPGHRYYHRFVSLRTCRHCLPFKVRKPR
jgi:hypothetical protein